MSYSFLWVIVVRRHVHTTYEYGTEYSETSVHNNQTLRNHPNERLQHSQQGEGLKSETKYIAL
jgi:ornithine carbamoyltransferase